MMDNTTPLVDVISLSWQLCSIPIEGDLKYSYDDNFMGRLVDGYDVEATEICLLAPNAARTLCEVQNYLITQHQLGLIILDAYRPIRATKDFYKWFNEPPHETEIHRKMIHYPTVDKNELVTLGYIADGISNHCYGQAVDVTLIDLRTFTELDMGTCFDYFDALSHSTQDEYTIGQLAYQNRMCLINAMQLSHFKVHPKEYWHFDFHIRENQEPLDIIIEPSLKGLGIHLHTESA